MKVVYKFVKRAFDFTMSLLAILVTGPLWGIFALAIKLSSKGPVFFTTDRIGKDRKPFTLYKFRTMHEYVPDPENPEKKMEGHFITNEDRVFKFGGLLRKCKLDELPQLLNILKGEMSIVGPRPMSPRGVELYYNGEYERITSVQPGLACLDSLYDYAHGEMVVTDNTEYKQKVLPVRTELAAMYVDKRSVGLDIYCICRTVELMWKIAVKKQKEFPLTGFEKKAAVRIFGKDSVNK